MKVVGSIAALGGVALMFTGGESALIGGIVIGLGGLAVLCLGLLGARWLYG